MKKRTIPDSVLTLVGDAQFRRAVRKLAVGLMERSIMAYVSHRLRGVGMDKAAKAAGLSRVEALSIEADAAVRGVLDVASLDSC